VGTQPRLIVLGIDGATWDVALPYIEAGRLPALERLTEDGAWGALLSVHPPVTACCWPTMLTGANPGRHGMFEFFTMRDGTYDRRPTTLLDWRRPPLWQLLNRCGLSVGVFNVPVTFPAQPVDGYMVSGEMGTPRVDRRMFYPAQVRQTISAQLRRYELGPISGRTSRDVGKLTRQIAARNAAALALAEQHPTDVVIIVVNYVDHAQHFSWDERYDGLLAPAQEHNPMLLAYQGADRLLESLRKLAGPDCTTIVLSDHGAGPVRGYLDVEHMLAGLGYLQSARTASGNGMAAHVRRTLQALRPLASAVATRLPSRLRHLARRLGAAALVDYGATTVFPVGGCCSLRVNVLGREPAGCVPAAELEGFCLDVREALCQIEGLDGEQLFEVYLNRELYGGPHAGLGPDLIGVPQRYSVETVSAGPACRRWLVSRDEAKALGLPHCVRQGNHRLEGVVAAIGPGVTPGHAPDLAPIVDVAPTVMSLLGCPVPPHMDGDVMTWARQQVARRVVRRPGQRPPTSPRQPQSYTPSEETVVTDRLERLGYTR